MIPIPLAALAGGGWKKLAIGLVAVIIVSLVVAAAAWRGYHAGYESADLERQAEVAALNEEHTQVVAAIQEQHLRALAKAESVARQRLEQAVVRNHTLESQYQAAQQTIEKQSRELTNQRIVHASKDVDTADGSCRFGPEWVRLYNEAIGASAGNGGDAVPAAASDPDANATAGAAVETGILQEQVTPEDILAHARDYGERNREMEAQLGALIEWANGLNSVGDRP